jgi:hypothetical protein
MAESPTVLVTAPNGKRYRFHEGTKALTGYVYALGHRVYGTVDGGAYNTDTGKFEVAFTPTGKWAFIVAAVAAPANLADANIG